MPVSIDLKIALLIFAVSGMYLILRGLIQALWS